MQTIAWKESYRWRPSDRGAAVLKIDSDDSFREKMVFYVIILNSPTRMLEILTQVSSLAAAADDTKSIKLLLFFNSDTKSLKAFKSWKWTERFRLQLFWRKAPLFHSLSLSLHLFALSLALSVFSHQLSPFLTLSSGPFHQLSLSLSLRLSVTISLIFFSLFDFQAIISRHAHKQTFSFH